MTIVPSLGIIHCSVCLSPAGPALTGQVVPPRGQGLGVLWPCWLSPVLLSLVASFARTVAGRLGKKHQNRWEQEESLPANLLQCCIAEAHICCSLKRLLCCCVCTPDLL